MNTAFVTTLDDSYVPGFLLTLHSMFRSCKSFHWDLVILEWGNLSDCNKRIIESMYTKTRFKRVNESSYFNNHGHDDVIRKWNYNCNYRFDIFCLTEYEKIVYFDSDILFGVDMRELLDIELQFGACAMPTYTHYNHVLNSKIFNAGLMVIGESCLGEHIKQELIDIANSPPPTKCLHSNKWFGNQPILNNYFYSKTTWLPQKYNYLTEDLTLAAFNHPINLHYAGSKKPWFTGQQSDSYDKHIVESIKDKTDNIVLRNMIVKKAHEKAMNAIKELLTEYPKIPFFGFARTEN